MKIFTVYYIEWQIPINVSLDTIQPTILQTFFSSNARNVGLFYLLRC